MRTIGAAVLGLLVLASAAGAFVLATLDPNDHKALIEGWAGDALGAEIRIDGPITLSRSLTPTLVANGVRVVAPGQSEAAAAIDRIELSVVLSSLLFGPVHLPLVAIDGATLDLPLRLAGSSSGADGQVPMIDRLALARVTIRYGSHGGEPFEAVIERANLAPAADRAATVLEASGTIGGLPVEVQGSTGRVQALFATATDWPLAIDATVGEGKVKLKGSVSLAGGALSYRADADLDLPAAPKLAESLAIPALPLQATARLRGDERSLAIQDLQATFGHSDLAGDLAWQDGSPGKLTARLAAKRIDLVQLGLTGAGAEEGQTGVVVPNLPLPMPARVPLDLAIDATVGQLDLAARPFTDLAASARAGAGKLVLDLGRAKLGGGSLQARYQAEGAQPAIVFRLDAAGIDLADLFGKAGGGGKLPNDVSVAIDLRGQGSRLPGFLGSASGPIAITTGPAVIDDAFAERLGRSLLTAVLPGFDSHGAHILCSVLDLEAKDGKARSTALVIDGKHVLVGGGGAIDLATGRIDLMLLPKAKDATLAPLVTPVHLAGPITDPQVVGDAETVLSSAGHLLLGIVNPLSLVTPILHPGRSGDAACRDPALAQQSDPVEAVGSTAVDAVTGAAKGIGSALERVGKGASELLDDITGR